MDVLIVEDDPISRKLLSRTLSQLDYRVIEAKDGREAWRVLQRRPVQLVVTDWIMPEMDGITLTRLIREADLPGYVYIVILTGRRGIDNVVGGLDAGADDYLVKPFNPKELHARLRIGQRVLDLEQRLRGAYEKMLELAMHDELTGLWNRRAFYTHALAELERSTRQKHSLCLALLDIDHFKKVNDEHGHLMGDQALKMVADTIRTNLRTYDRAGRWGGEEFIVLLPDTKLNEAAEIAERLRLCVSEEKLTLMDADQVSHILNVQISLGVACSQNSDITSLDVLVDRADEKLYQAKNAGRNRVCY